MVARGEIAVVGWDYEMRNKCRGRVVLERHEKETFQWSTWETLTKFQVRDNWQWIANQLIAGGATITVLNMKGSVGTLFEGVQDQFCRVLFEAWQRGTFCRLTSFQFGEWREVEEQTWRLVLTAVKEGSLPCLLNFYISEPLRCRVFGSSASKSSRKHPKGTGLFKAVTDSRDANEGLTWYDNFIASTVWMDAVEFPQHCCWDVTIDWLASAIVKRPKAMSALLGRDVTSTPDTVMQETVRQQLRQLQLQCNKKEFMFTLLHLR